MSKVISNDFNSVTEYNEQGFPIVTNPITNYGETDILCYYIFIQNLIHIDPIYEILPSKLCDLLNQKKIQIIFTQYTEGDFYKDWSFKWISDFSKKYNLGKKNCIILTSNLKAKKLYHQFVNDNIILDNFSVIEYSFFSSDLWFTTPNGSLCNNYIRNQLKEQHEKNLENFIKTKKVFHFLCFNRIPRPHKVCLFAEIMSNNLLKNKTLITFSKNVPSQDSYFNLVNNWIDDDYKYDKCRLLNYLKYYDELKSITYDFDEQLHVKTSSFNKEAHNKCFLNIVTETFCTNESIFLSEKTFKPIYACQPFIILGNPHSLKKLREMGYKTFSNWWDESYDEEENFTKKLEKIVTVLEKLSNLTLDECEILIKEMQDTLSHNYLTLVNNRESEYIENYINSLYINDTN